ncbi:MAG: acyloxyacyl hydrolase [Alphaproteobacteria bacterium]|nr:acyloxyacyl hydrolase [Alphaproteobacteria bacterium]MCL2758384.1 acyloxyacyl hydrolase [Alphaproteobacteria bacterium]
MKKLILVPVFMLCGFAAAADFAPPMFGGHRNQIAINVGQGTDATWLLPLPGRRAWFAMYEFRYSQPNSFFRLPGRQNLNIAYIHGWRDDDNWAWTDVTVPLFYWSQDAVLYSTRNWYHGGGMGVGMQLQENDRIGTKLIFAFKLFSGYRLSDTWNMELFMQHFSNGSTSDANYSYNFFGVGFVRNF